MTEIKIRKATKEDVPHLYKLILQLAEFEDGLHEVSITEDDLARDGFGSDPLFEALIAEADNKPAGAAIYFYSYSTWEGRCLYLEDLIVDREIRSKGIGMALMKELIKIADKAGVKRLSWQVLEWNVDARDFYEKLGARLDGEWLNGRLNQRQIQTLAGK